MSILCPRVSELQISSGCEHIPRQSHSRFNKQSNGLSTREKNGSIINEQWNIDWQGINTWSLIKCGFGKSWLTQSFESYNERNRRIMQGMCVGPFFEISLQWCQVILAEVKRIPSISSGICFKDDWKRTVFRLSRKAVIYGHLRDSESQWFPNSGRSWLNRSL
jgi:hypothetical protein